MDGQDERVYDGEVIFETPPDPPPEWLTKAQVARLMQVSPKTVERHVAAGRLTAIRPPPGRLVRFDKTEVIAFMAEVATVVAAATVIQ